MRQGYGCHSRLGAHCLSQDALRSTKETETLDACIEYQSLCCYDGVRFRLIPVCPRSYFSLSFCIKMV